MASDSDRVRAQVRKWRDDLVNLNRRNKLLYFKHTKTSSIEIVAPSCDVILRLLESGQARMEFYEPLVLPAPSDSRRSVRPPAKNEAVCQVWKGSAADGGLADASKADLAKILRGLDRQARAEFMDRGLQSLYLGMGLLEWTDPKLPSEINVGPLLLVPVELERTGPGDPYRLVRAQDDIVLNPALQLKLENDFGVVLPARDDDEGSCDEYFERVRQSITRQPDWEVRDLTVLARFSFLKEVMYRDLLEHEDEICAHPLVRALSSPAGSRSDFDFEPVDDSELDRVAVDSTLLSIRDADATQRACIWAAREGRTFVMDGPPGTGKSQTIANMIAELIGNGRSVLFVSEKAAALEVVHSRLQECGLDEYVLQLHSHKATRREVARQLSNSVSKRPRMNGQLSDSDISALHRRRKQLSDYAAAMNEVREPLGVNLFDAIGRAAGLHEVSRPSVRPEIDVNLSAGRFASVIAAANDLQRAWGPVERDESFVWKDLSVGRIDAARRAEIGELLGSTIDANSEIERCLEEANVALQGWETAAGVNGLIRVLQLLGAVAEAPETKALWLSHDDFANLSQAVDELDSIRTDYDERLDEVRQAAGSSADMATVLEIVSGYGEVESLCERAGQWVPGDAWMRTRLQEAASTCSRLEDTVRVDVSEALKELLSATGITTWSSPTLGDARDLSELLGMAERSERPEADWLSLARLSELKDAQPVLTSLVLAMREKRERVSAVYKPTVLDLDADALSQRFSQVHVGAGRVSFGYLKDRKTVATVSRTGKFSQAAVDLLPVVVELQKLSADLAAFERNQSQLVGSYYRGEETDLERLDRAVRLAESALSLVEHRGGLSRALRSVALQADMDPGVLLAARRLHTAIDAIEDQTRSLGIDEGDVFSLPLETLAERFERVTAAMNGWANFADRFDPDPTVQVLTECAAAAKAVVATLDREETVRPRLESLIGDSYRGVQTDIVTLRDRVQGASAIRDVLGASVPTVVGERILTQHLDMSEMRVAVDRWEELTRGLLDLFTKRRAKALGQQMSDDSAQAARLLSLMSASIDDIDEWIAFVDSGHRLTALGLEAALAACITQRIPQKDVAKVIERVVLETWIDAVVEVDSKRLTPLRARDRQALRAEFVSLDKRLVRAAAGRVMASCNARRPSKNFGAVGIILREGEKKTRHMPIRTLLEKTKADAQAIKPCFMMSPLSVSQFLPPDLRFDVVLFDEASQIRPHDAINCVYRGNQHVIAGDQQQLPPTSFFDGVIDDGDDVWNEEDLESFESVLDVAKSCASIPSLPLRWHYRSRHEDLITYSNVSFYDSALISFPAPHVTAPTLGVGFNKVDGTYRRGKGTPNDNPVEARAVAELVAQYAKHHPKLTLGVVAFSSAQGEAIENAIEQLRIEDATLPSGYFDTERLDGFFVKNLETVQGDERDVIILSVGYGRDEAGKLLLNFGPINKAGGYRRLNVAVTRARMRLEVVASITGADISAASENDGVRHMKRYLEYAERGPSVLSVGDGRSLGEVESPFEAEVVRVIRSWGYDAVTQVGTAGYRIDMALVHPDQPGRLCLAIECDGAAYHSSKVARDRDRLRDEVLQGLGWRIHRIWGTAWFRQRDQAERELRSAIEASILECDSVVTDEGLLRFEASAPDIEIEEVEVGGGFEAEDWVVDYRLHVPKLSALDRRTPMGDRSASPIMQRELPEIVRVEGPVHRDMVLDRLMQAWGVKRAGHNIIAEFETALKYCQRAGHIEIDERDFIRTTGERSLTRARRPISSDDRTQRSCFFVCGQEFDLAVARILASVTTIGESQLNRNVAAVFGWERVGPDIRTQIAEAVTRVGASQPDLTRRIVSDDDLPKSQSASRTRTKPTTVGLSGSKPDPVQAADSCPVCKLGFGEKSKPTDLTFYESGRSVKKAAHQTCVDRLKSGRQRMPGYRWESVRGGLVPVRSNAGSAGTRAVVVPTESQSVERRVVGWDTTTNTPVIE